MLQLASGGGRPEWACAPSLRSSGISRRALGPRGPAPAMSPSLKGGGDARPWRWRQVWRPFFASSNLATRLLSGRRCGGCCPPARPPARSSVEETPEEGLRGKHPLDPCGLGAGPHIPSSLAVASAKGSVPFFVACSSPRQGKLPRRWQCVCIFRWLCAGNRL